MSLITYENLADGQKVTANIFNERYAMIIAQINGNIDDSNIKDDSISKQKLKAEVFESMYPVGSQYVNYTDNTNPATLLGFGTWSAIAGRVTVGYDGTQTEFNAAEKTGGHKSLQAHVHGLDGRILVGQVPSSGMNSGIQGGGSYTKVGNIADSDGADTTYSAGDGNGQNLPPYITAYVWKRIS